MRVVKSFVREDYEEEKFGRRGGRLRRLHKGRAHPGLERASDAVLPLHGYGRGAVFGSYIIITSRGLELDVGQFSALLTYSFMMLSSLMMLSMCS